MVNVRVFRNDGEELFAADPGTLEYIDPGVVLLYADTRADVVCSYLEGRLGQPVQATAECRFATDIDLPRVRSAVEAVDAPGFSIASASRENATSAQWALDGLDEEPLRVGEPELDAIRRLVDGSATDGGGGLLASALSSAGAVDVSPRAIVDGLLLADADTDDEEASDDGGATGDAQATDGGTAAPRPAGARTGGDGAAGTDGDGPVADHRERGGASLDFAVRSTYDAARFFAFLVDALADTAATVAVSKAGRVDAIADADVVIHPDGDLDPGNRVEPRPDTQARIDVEREHATREHVRERLTDPVTDLGDAYQDAVTDPGVDGDVADAVLGKLLDAELGPRSTLAVVDRWRARYRRARVAVLAGVLGVLAGVLGAEPIRFAADRAAVVARGVAATDPATVRGALVDAASGAGRLAGLLVPAAAALVLAAAVLLQRRRRRRTGHGLGGNARPSTARSDVVRLALATVAVGALLVLAGSTVLLLLGA